MKAWFKRVCDRLVDRLAALIWESFCRLALMEPIKTEIDSLREQVARLATLGSPVAMIRLDVGRTEGAISDLRHVEFQGKQVARFQDSVGSFRVQEELYRTVDGELLVHVKELEKSAGFPTTYSLYAIEEADLAEGGPHEKLGKAWKALSLTEVLE